MGVGAADSSATDWNSRETCEVLVLISRPLRDSEGSTARGSLSFQTFPPSHIYKNEVMHIILQLLSLCHFPGQFFCFFIFLIEV